MQVLDNLFFDFIDLSKELQPKVVVAENVKGLLLGAAKDYVRRIYKAFDEAGYFCQHFLLNASKMGVPQRRQRVFFICLRKDLAINFLHQKDLFTFEPFIKMEFKEKEIAFKEFDSGKFGSKIIPSVLEWFEKTNQGESVGNCIRRHGFKETFFSYCKLNNNKSLKTILANPTSGEFRHDAPYMIHDDDIILAGSFPKDYNFLKTKVKYLVGMSVPPVMTAQIATEIYNQWLSKL
jgi:DNA (cytosine-5)-methyltransferase 1